MKTLLLLLIIAFPLSAATRLGVTQTNFIINGQPAFLLGISYYAGLGASDKTLKRDLDEIQRHKFNWLRLWATWAAFGTEVSAVDANGNAREPYVSKLKALVRDCDKRGLIVDVTLSRGNGVTGPSRLGDLSTHSNAVFTIVSQLKEFPNWYLDLSNERNISDKRFTSFDDLAVLRQLVRKLDPPRLVTASQGGDIGRDELAKYLNRAKVDFICPHRPRDADSPSQTAAKTREYLKWMQELGRIVPVHYQEPFRRGYAGWDPKAADFIKDLTESRTAGAAGWCFHNGSQRTTDDSHPRRSFDLTAQPMFNQFDPEERKFLEHLLVRTAGRD